MGYLKLTFTVIKYSPQVYWNYKRKSTKGWSIFNVLTDSGGGTLSLLQMILELALLDAKFNAVKTILGLITIIYDTIFIIQHYYFYRKKKNPNESVLT